MDANELRERLFDEETAPALAALEDGPQNLKHLAGLCDTTEDALREKFSYLVDAGFLTMRDDTYEADSDKMAALMEQDDYSGLVDGMTTMDSYLN